MDEERRLDLRTLRERPDLAPVVADWIWRAFWKPAGCPLHEVEALLDVAVTGLPIPQTWVLLDSGRPVATASLVAHDLDARPDLGPWLAAVFVTPAARGRGHAARLVAAVERAARHDAGADRLWLYTELAERLYARCGWIVRDRFRHMGAACTLMSKDLRDA